MRPECIRAVGRHITQAEAQKIEQRIKEAQQYLWKKDRSAMTGLTKNQQFQLAADQAAKDIKAEAAKKQQRVALTILAHEKINTYIEEAFLLASQPSKLLTQMGTQLFIQGPSPAFQYFCRLPGRAGDLSLFVESKTSQPNPLFLIENSCAIQPTIN